MFKSLERKRNATGYFSNRKSLSLAELPSHADTLSDRIASMFVRQPERRRQHLLNALIACFGKRIESVRRCPPAKKGHT